MQDHMAAPEKHLPQRLLAQEVTELVHGGVRQLESNAILV